MELYSKGNEAFVAEEYEKAVELYSQAIAEDSSKSDFFSNRSQAFVKLEKYGDALADAVKAIELDSKNTKAYLRKGIAQFYLKAYHYAKTTFQEGEKVDASSTLFSSWIQKCEAELIEERKTREANKLPTSTAAPEVVAMPTASKTRYDWYQTDSHVVVTLLLKKVKEEDLLVNIQPRTLSVLVKLSSGSDFSLELDLLHETVPDRSSVKIMSTKVEIKLAKKEGIRWTNLEGEEDTSIKHFKPEPHKYPTSSHYTRDWDKLAKDITQEEKDNLEGEAALNNLFQQIYRDGSDEVKKAMNKSFQESGGTVLSTNWGDIGKAKTEIKPPDGMEYRKWDQ